MKITQTISELQKILEISGDVDVFVSDGTFRGTLKLAALSFYKDGPPCKHYVLFIENNSNKKNHEGEIL